MAYVYDVYIDLADVEDLFNNPDGPVGVLLQEMAVKASAYAKGLAPVMKPENYSWVPSKSTSYGPPGRTKFATHPHFPGYTKSGRLFGGVDTVYGPTLFLEKPAEQLHYPRRFLSDALDLLTL